MGIQTAVVGLQSVYWPGAFANCLMAIPGADLVSCADLGYEPDLVRISLGRTPEEYATHYGISLYHDPIEMIRQEGVRAVCICAKPTEVAALVELVAPTGVDLYIAKPMATTLEAADRIVAAVRSNDLIATSGTTERFDGGIRDAYRRLQDDAIGDLISIRALHQHGSIDGFPAGDWYWDKAQGGPEFSLVWYVADIVRWFANSEVARVYAEYDNYASEESPFMDNAKILLRFSSRIMGSIDIYFSVRGWAFPSYELELMGTKGALRTQQNVYEGTLFTQQGIQNFYRIQNDNLLAEMQHWMQCCANRADPELTIEDAHSIIEVCIACRDSALTHTPITLPLRA